MSEIDNDILNKFFWLNTLVFLLYTSMASFVLYKVRFKLDNVSKFSMSAAFLSFLIRFVNWLVHKVQGFNTTEG
jgi:hypothetical protein